MVRKSNDLTPGPPASSGSAPAPVRRHGKAMRFCNRRFAVESATPRPKSPANPWRGRRRGLATSLGRRTSRGRRHQWRRDQALLRRRGGHRQAKEEAQPQTPLQEIRKLQATPRPRARRHRAGGRVFFEAYRCRGGAHPGEKKNRERERPAGYKPPGKGKRRSKHPASRGADQPPLRARSAFHFG